MIFGDYILEDEAGEFDDLGDFGDFYDVDDFGDFDDFDDFGKFFFNCSCFLCSLVYPFGFFGLF